MKLSKSRAYIAWMHMKDRCFNPRCQVYSYYGSRGITVCERWMKFANFHADMGDPPPKHSLDRIDNDGNYEPGNCRWATSAEQMSNTRHNTYYEVNGERKTLAQWARDLGMAATNVCNRIKRGWSIERALTTPSTQPKKGLNPKRYDGKTLRDCCREAGVKYTTVQYRLSKGWALSEALSAPAKK